MSKHNIGIFVFSIQKLVSTDCLPKTFIPLHNKYNNESLSFSAPSHGHHHHSGGAQLSQPIAPQQSYLPPPPAPVYGPPQQHSAQLSQPIAGKLNRMYKSVDQFHRTLLEQNEED